MYIAFFCICLLYYIKNNMHENWTEVFIYFLFFFFNSGLVGWTTFFFVMINVRLTWIFFLKCIFSELDRFYLVGLFVREEDRFSHISFIIFFYFLRSILCYLMDHFFYKRMADNCFQRFIFRLFCFNLVVIWIQEAIGWSWFLLIFFSSNFGLLLYSDANST